MYSGLDLEWGSDSTEMEQSLPSWNSQFGKGEKLKTSMNMKLLGEREEKMLDSGPAPSWHDTGGCPNSFIF